MKRDEFEGFLRESLRHGSTHRVLLASPEAAHEIQELGNYETVTAEVHVGRVFRVDFFIFGAYGFKIPVCVMPGWDGAFVFMLDLESTRYGAGRFCE